jgi:hypothetical protein
MRYVLRKQDVNCRELNLAHVQWWKCSAVGIATGYGFTTDRSEFDSR